MRRRTVLACGRVALAAASIPSRRVFAAGTADVAAIGFDGKSNNLKGGEVDHRRACASGEVLTADQSGYDTARRLWNPAFDCKPALIGPGESPFVTELWYAVVPGYASQYATASRRVCESLGAAVEVWLDQQGA